MYKFLSKNGQLLAFGLGVLVVAIFLITAVPNAPQVEKEYSTTAFDVGLYLTIALILISVALIVLFGLTHTVTNFKSSLQGILGLAALVALFIVAYIMSKGEATAYVQGAIDKVAENGGEVTMSNIKFIDGALITALGTILISGIVLVGGEIINLFK